VAFWGRGSQALGAISVAHCASLGSADPGGSVPKYATYDGGRGVLIGGMTAVALGRGVSVAAAVGVGVAVGEAVAFKVADGEALAK
jgi:hypothetical protein